MKMKLGQKQFRDTSDHQSQVFCNEALNMILTKTCFKFQNIICETNLVTLDCNNQK